MLCPVRARLRHREFFPTARRGRRRTGTFRTGGRGYSESAAFTTALIGAANAPKGRQNMGKNGALLHPAGGNWMSARGCLTPAGRPRRARKKGGGFLPYPLYLLPPHGARSGPRRPRRCLLRGAAAMPRWVDLCARRRPRHGSTKKRVPFGHPLSICIAQFAFILVERIAGKPCQLHDLYV